MKISKRFHRWRTVDSMIQGGTKGEERLAGGGRRIACQIVIVLKDRGEETVAWRAKHACNRPGDLRDPISAQLCQEIETLSWIAGKIASFLPTILYFPLFLLHHSPPRFVLRENSLKRVFPLSKDFKSIIFLEHLSRYITIFQREKNIKRERRRRKGGGKSVKRCRTYNVYTHTHTQRHTRYIYAERKSGRYAEYLFHGRINGEIICPPPPPPPPWNRVESQAAKFSFVSESISRENTLKWLIRNRPVIFDTGRDKSFPFHANLARRSDRVKATWLMVYLMTSDSSVISLSFFLFSFFVSLSLSFFSSYVPRIPWIYPTRKHA